MSKIKGFIRSSLLKIDFSGLVQRVRGPGIVILRYHSVRTDPEACRNTIGLGIIHPAHVFEQQMQFLSRNYEILNMEDVFRFVTGDRSVDRKSVVVSFDDGFDDNHNVAAAIMAKHGIRGTFYVTVDNVDRRKPLWFVRLRTAFYGTASPAWTCFTTRKEFPLDNEADRNRAFVHACRLCAPLSGSEKEAFLVRVEGDIGTTNRQDECFMLEWDHVRSLSSAGHTIGSHTMTHPNMAYVENADTLKFELQSSKNRLEAILQKPVQDFSYPSPILEPHWNERTAKAVREAGYKTAVTCVPGVVREGSDPLCLRRISVPFDLSEFAWKIEGSLAGFRI
ncbi:MAG: polysaccharide deacetylase family protein [Candidatus Eisenbacteria bacterium]|nr:polysaccharide deacetylase family protein [Candidatus Eisenbacteria bacterium]